MLLSAGGSDQHNYHQDQHHHLRLFMKGVWTVHAPGGSDQQAQPGRLPGLDCLPHCLLHDRYYFSVIHPTIEGVNGCVWVVLFLFARISSLTHHDLEE